MTTWRDVDRVRQEHPEFSYPQLAAALGCVPQYVSATFARRKWPRAPKGERPHLSDEAAAAVVADYKLGLLYREIAARHGIAAGYVGILVRRFAPDQFKQRTRGRRLSRRLMCDADLWGVAA